MKTIWCLFHVAHDYNQPQNNLQAWFSSKPNSETLAEHLHTTLSHPDRKEMVDKILNGGKSGGYRLEEVTEQTKLK